MWTGRRAMGGLAIRFDGFFRDRDGGEFVQADQRLVKGGCDGDRAGQ
ncbi:hypothetical protein MXF23_18005 [Klebsiella quasipneumoniae]|nr:hypothetical protein [Klebsiella quasipneumoniae]MEB6156694.1 hypothetical protein [Klebsiella quasipneumoniae]